MQRSGDSRPIAAATKKSKVDAPTPTPSPAAPAPAAGLLAVPVAGLALDRVRETTRTATEERRKEPARNSPYPARSDRPGLDPNRIAVELPRVTEPDVYNGDRNSLWFYDNVEASMLFFPKSCAKIVNGGPCGATHDIELDHVTPFAGRITDAETREYCFDGVHFRAVPLDEALAIYNARVDRKASASADLARGKFQWLCQHHNGSKNGPQGNDGMGPRRIGSCPEVNGDGPCKLEKLSRADRQRRRRKNK